MAMRRRGEAEGSDGKGVKGKCKGGKWITRDARARIRERNLMEM